MTYQEGMIQAQEPAQWFLIQCKPRECERARDHLENQGLDTFLPMHPVRRKRSGRVYYGHEPLFPHYLFLATPLQSNWPAIRSTRGVARVVSFQGRPHAVAESVVEGLRYQVDRLNGIEPEPLFRTGSKVRITEGCFRDLEAIVKCSQGDERVVLLLNMMQRQQQIELPVSAVSAG